MNKQQVIAAVKAGTHRILSISRRNGSGRYVFERLSAAGWIGCGIAHNATVRAAAGELTPTFDAATSGVRYI
jgi:hypothetical protein